MLRVVPDLPKARRRTIAGHGQRYFKSDKMRQVFSFEPLLVGGNPMKVPSMR
jgi:phytoene desaturase